MKLRHYRVLLGGAFLLGGFGFSQVFYALLEGAGYFTPANIALFAFNGIGVFGFIVCVYSAIRSEVG